MRSSLLSLVGGLLLGAAGVSAALTVPVTPPRFQANFAQDIKINLLGGMTSSEVISSGKIAYDGLQQRTLTNLLSITTSTPTAPGSPPVVVGPLAVDQYYLVDNGANLMLSWGVEGESCGCEQPGDKNKFLPMFVPQTAEFQGMETITVGGQSITAGHWNDSLLAGMGAESAAMGAAMIGDWWVSTTQPQVLVRMVNTMSISISIPNAPAGFPGTQAGEIVFSIDFTSVTVMPVDDVQVNAIFKPSSSCPSCAAAPSNIATSTSYTVAPATCPSQCLCASDYSAGLTYFKDVVTYPIVGLMDPAVIDTTTQAMYSSMIAAWNLAGITHSATCDAELKAFMAHFYFKECSAGGIVAYPAWDNAVWTDKCGSTVASSLKSSSLAATYGSAATGTKSSDATTTAQASLLLGVVLAAAARFMA